MNDDYSDLIARLHRIAKISYGATIEEGREVSKTQREAADTIERLCNDVAFERDLRASFALECKEARIEIAKKDDRIAALESQLAARESAEPVAWLTHGALAGNPMLTFEPISEIASEPLYAHPPAAAASDRYSWTETGMKHDVEGSWVLASHNVKLPF